MLHDELIGFWGTKDVGAELRKSIMMAVIGLILAFIGPYDTSTLPADHWRVIYWVSLLLLTSILTGPIARITFPSLAPHITNPAFFLMAYSAIMSVPVFFAVVGTDIYIHAWANTGQNPTLEYAYRFLTYQGLTWDVFLLWYGKVVIIMFMSLGAISLINHATRPKEADLGINEQQPSPPAGYLFLRRLPPQLGQNLTCLQMEDHYLRAFTDKGNALIRVRFRDALAELDGYPGLQVHRSWWVALAAIESVKRDGRRHAAYLRGGLQAPVSKTYADQLKAAGFL